nr:aminotransferase class V-fold PLP-dependent enzyme [Bacteroidota bacterium]
ALYIRRKNPRVTIYPILDGGGQERGLRPGTLNVPGIVGFGKACEIASGYLTKFQLIQKLRDNLENELLKFKGVKINGINTNRLPNTSNLTFANFKADTLISAIKEIAISTGSACTSAIPEPSHVLKAMGLSEEEAFGSIRISLGRQTTAKEIEFVIEAFGRFFKNR